MSAQTPAPSGLFFFVLTVDALVSPAHAPERRRPRSHLCEVSAPTAAEALRILQAREGGGFLSGRVSPAVDASDVAAVRASFLQAANRAMAAGWRKADLNAAVEAEARRCALPGREPSPAAFLRACWKRACEAEWLRELEAAVRAS